MADAVRTTRWEQGSPSGPGPDRAASAVAVRQVVGPAVDRLVTAGALTEEQAVAVRREVDVELGEPAQISPSAVPAGAQPASPPSAPPEVPAFVPPLPDEPPLPAGARILWAPVLAEVGGYIGGAFVLGAAAVLVSANWNDLPSTARLAVLAVPAVLLLMAAVAVTRSAPDGLRSSPVLPGVIGEHGRGPRRRLVAALVTVAAALLGLAAAVLADAASASEEVTVLIGFWAALAVAAVGYTVCRGELLQFATGFSVLGAVLATQSALGEWEARQVGWALATIGLAWGLATLVGVFAEREFGFGWAGLLAFAGGELLVGSGAAVTGYAVLVALAAVGLAGFVVQRVLALLVTGVTALAVVVPQAVIDVTDGALGAAGALLLVGLSIVGASVLGFRLHRTTTTD